MNRVLFFLRMLIPLAYIAIGFTLLFNTGGVRETVPAPYNYILGIGSVAYGLFRAYRIYTTENTTY